MFPEANCPLQACIDLKQLFSFHQFEPSQDQDQSSLGHGHARKGQIELTLAV
jgi:hypothetical protein